MFHWLSQIVEGLWLLQALLWIPPFPLLISLWLSSPLGANMQIHFEFILGCFNSITAFVIIYAHQDSQVWNAFVQILGHFGNFHLNKVCVLL